MAKARAIVKRRKAVRNIRKITKTMQMIATAKFQKSLKRTVGTKPYTQKVRELVAELAASVGDVEHPLLRQPDESGSSRRVALVVITSNRGLAGAYNGNVLRTSTAAIREFEGKGSSIELFVGGKKGISYYNFQKRTIAQRLNVSDTPRFSEVEPLANQLMDMFTSGKVDAVYIGYMNFLSAGVQKAEVMQLLPLAAPKAETQNPNEPIREQAVYEFSPDPKSLLDELLPQTVRAAVFQAFMDATTSEHVARMVAMKSATDNADKMSKALTMQYNRARQSQITTELSEIMGGVEAMKG